MLAGESGAIAEPRGTEREREGLVPCGLGLKPFRYSSLCHYCNELESGLGWLRTCASPELHLEVKNFLFCITQLHTMRACTCVCDPYGPAAWRRGKQEAKGEMAAHGSKISNQIKKVGRTTVGLSAGGAKALTIASLSQAVSIADEQSR